MGWRCRALSTRSSEVMSHRLSVRFRPRLRPVFRWSQGGSRVYSALTRAGRKPKPRPEDSAGLLRCASEDRACDLMQTQSRPRLPAWLRGRLPTTQTYAATRRLLGDLRLHTVCESAQCPNHWECWSHGTATFMIGGDRCTRACGFCAVTTAKPLPLDPDEPPRVAEAARRMRLRHVVITAVARDDLPDGGAAHFRHTIEAVRRLNPGIVIEVLTPDFNDRATPSTPCSPRDRTSSTTTSKPCAG